MGCSNQQVIAPPKAIEAAVPATTAINGVNPIDSNCFINRHPRLLWNRYSEYEIVLMYIRGRHRKTGSLP